MIEITKEELKRRFIQYDNYYFDGQLKMCKFSILRGIDGALGEFRSKTKRHPPVIAICNKVDWTEETLCNLMVHEMVHYYVASIKHYDGVFSHGWKFIRKARELNRKYGLRIERVPHIYRRGEKPPTTLLGEVWWQLRYFTL